MQEISKNDDGSLTVIMNSGNIYKVTESGEITQEQPKQPGDEGGNPEGSEPENPGIDNTLVAMYKAGTLKQGDYVNYSPNGQSSYELAASLTGMEESQTIAKENLTWRVLGCDGTNVLLISAEPTLYGMQFYGEVGYNNYETILNNTCNALYSNSNIGATARSITSQDIETYLGIGYYYTWMNSLDEETLEEIDYGEDIVKALELYYSNLNETKIEMIMGPQNNPAEWQLYGDNKYKVPFFYLVANKRQSYETESKLIDGYGLGMLLPGAEQLITDDKGTLSNRDNGNSRCFRPIVCLSSNTTIDQVSIIEGENPTWSWYDYYERQLGS